MQTHQTSIVYGADGCQGGWVAISKNLATGDISWRLYPTAHGLVYAQPVSAVIAVDIPIGLPDFGPRSCDIEARKLLGKRHPCVFPAPIRPALLARSWEEASRIRQLVEGKKMSLQAAGILPKIRAMDEILSPDPMLQKRIREVHPELSFWFLNNRTPLKYSKKKRLGLDERKKLLAPQFGQSVEQALEHRRGLRATQNDILDAFAALWTAERIACGVAETIPASPPRDSCGLTMEMVV